MSKRTTVKRSKQSRRLTVAERLLEIESRLHLVETTISTQVMTEAIIAANQAIEKLLTNIQRADEATDSTR